MQSRYEISASEAPAEPLLSSFFLAGFECASHRRIDGVRLDLLSSTRHDVFAHRDYERVRALGIGTVRDGVRWHLIQGRANNYRWDSWLPMVQAARAGKIQVIWDLCHYGWPDDIDVWSARFVDEFARFAKAAARVVSQQSDDVPFYCPINEISFLSWAGGEVGQMNPGGVNRGAELKRQLVRASIASIHAIREVDPRARFIVSEPLIHVVPGSGSSPVEAEAYRLSQFEAHDFLCGRSAAELGGSEACLDIIGANFYCENQWFLNGSTIPLGHYAYRPLREMLAELHQRYERPLLISETGAEGSARGHWLNHVCSEVQHAIAAGAPVKGVTLYPILDYHGWEDNRVCRAGLWSLPTENGGRIVDAELLVELRRQMKSVAIAPRDGAAVAV